MEVIIIKQGDKIIQTYNLEKDRVKIGSDPANDIVLDNFIIDPFHAEIVKENGKWVFKDLGSEEGSYLDDIKTMEHILENGDEIQIANFVLIYDEGFVNDEETETKIIYTDNSEQHNSNGVPKLVTTTPLGEKVEYPINKDEMIIGRSFKADIVIEDTTISRMHAKISFQNGKFYIRDLESRNGTYVNKKKITVAEIKNGDIITFGTYSVKFVI